MVEEVKIGKVKYLWLVKYFFNKEGDFNNLIVVVFYRKFYFLVIGFVFGIFYFYELLEFNFIYFLSILD